MTAKRVFSDGDKLSGSITENIVVSGNKSLVNIRAELEVLPNETDASVNKRLQVALVRGLDQLIDAYYESRES